MDVGTHFYTWLCGRQVGTYRFGNRYYEHKSKRLANGKLKRGILFKELTEESKVFPRCHAWLRYNLEELPSGSHVMGYEWQKPHLPNLTGTKYSYRPPGHLARGLGPRVIMSPGSNPNSKGSLFLREIRLQ